jgi:hypothetical protein
VRYSYYVSSVLNQGRKEEKVVDHAPYVSSRWPSRDFEEPVRQDSQNDRAVAASGGRIRRVEGGKRDAFDSN